MQEELTLIIEAVNRAQATLNQVRRQTEQVARANSRAWEDSNRKTERSSRRMFTNMRQGWGQVIASISRARTAVAGFAVVAAGRSFIQAAMQLESMKNGLRAVVGSAEEAAATLDRLRKIALLPGIDLKQAIEASINLRSVKLSAELTERSLKAVGNALAIVGKSSELSGVVLGMTQMVSSGKVLQEEINQIASRIPQFRQAMIDAFGTARSEDIQKMGISVEEFLSKTTTELEKLDKVSEGASTAVSNLNNEFFNFTSNVGEKLLPAFIGTVNLLTGALAELNKAMNKTFPSGSARLEILNDPRQTPDDFVTATIMGNRVLPGNVQFDPRITENIDRLFAAQEARRSQSRADTREIINSLFFAGAGDLGRLQFPNFTPHQRRFPAFDELGARIGDMSESRQRRIDEIFGGGSTGVMFGLPSERLDRPRMQTPIAPIAGFPISDEMTRFLSTFQNDLTPTLEKSSVLVGEFTSTFLTGLNDIASATDNTMLNVVNSFLQLGIQISKIINSINNQGGFGALSGLSQFGAIGAFVGVGLTAVSAISSSGGGRRQSRQLQRIPRSSATAIR